jgi:hypothetical protein
VPEARRFFTAHPFDGGAHGFPSPCRPLTLDA